MRSPALPFAVVAALSAGSCRRAPADEVNAAPAPAPAPASAPTPAPAPTPVPDPPLGPGAIGYRLSPVFDGDALVALRVEIRLEADASGTTRIHLPQEWASERELWRYVDGIEATGMTEIRDDGPALRVIESEPGAPLRIAYRVVSAYDHEPRADDGQPFAPIIRPAWFHAFGESLFATPEGRDEAPVVFTWDASGSGLRLASDLQHLQAVGAVVANLRESIVLGARDLAILEESVDGAPLRVALVGEYNFSHPAFFAMARTIVRAERELWSDPGEPFTITVAPLTPKLFTRSLGGTGRADAFALTIAQDTPMEPLRHLLGHEYFHTWNPRLLGGQPDPGGGMINAWFNEGFTELYTWRLLLRSGLYQLEDFVDDWNRCLESYAESPVRNEPNTRIEADYWNDANVGQLPYLRGPMFGALLEQRLRRATGGARGLDDVLRAMRESEREASDLSQLPTTVPLFVATYHRLGGPDLAADLERFIERGETIVLPEDVFGGCLRVEAKPGSTVGVQRLRIVGAATPAERQACARVVSGVVGD